MNGKDSTMYRDCLRTYTSEQWKQVGQNKVLTLFHDAAERVPAYRDVLQKAGIHHTRIKTFTEFVEHVPVLDKQTYVQTYGLKDCLWNGNMSGGMVIAESSGTTGHPQRWPRRISAEQDVAIMHDTMLRAYADVEKKTTLFLVCFHLGSHIAGFITATALRDVVAELQFGALMTPGLNKEDILSAVRDLAPSFDQVMLVGYPPFLKDIVTEGKKRGFDWQAMHIRFLFAAEAFPEDWRDYVYREAGISDTLAGGMNIYGSADVGFMAHETPLSIAIRRGMQKDNQLPLYQWHPNYRFLEAVNGELCVTSDAGMPLIRYNMKDRGRVFAYDDIGATPDSSYPAEMWNLPFVVVEGRSDYAATIYGLNIYPDHVRDALSSAAVVHMTSGKFFLKTNYTSDQDQQLEVHIELLSGVEPTSDIRDFLARHVEEALHNVNLEYRKLKLAVGERARPHITVYESGAPAFTAVRAKHKYIVRDHT